MTLQVGEVGDRVRLHRASDRDRRSARWRRAASRGSAPPPACRGRSGTSGRPRAGAAPSRPSRRTPAVRHSSRSSVDAARAGRRAARLRRRRAPARRTSTTTSSARSRLSVAIAAGATRSNSSSSASISAAASSVLRWNGSVGSDAPGRLRPRRGGSRCATCRSAGRPSGCTPIAATRSRRSSARSTRSSRVSGSLRRWVCTRRRPRKRPRPGADAADLGQVDARGVADEDVLDLAAPADQDADLALDLARDAAQEGRPARPTRPPTGRSRRR